MNFVPIQGLFCRLVKKSSVIVKVFHNF
jgi:hypothetical protein